VLHLEGAKESGATDYEVTEKRLQTVSWNIYCSLLKNITSKYRSIGVEFPWKPGDQEQKIIAMKHRPRGDYFPGTQVDKCYSLHSEKQDV
jgi:hypothetical protein